MKFELTSVEILKINEWKKSLPVLEKVGAIGGAYTYSFTPTGLGIVIKITRADGQELDLTDYESW